jgi:branched-subunit amino acid aminotransferase/4-amino-4-deoxychorismate lyase
MLMEWLKEKGVPFIEKDITVDEQAYHEALEKAHQPVVPIVSIVGEKPEDETIIIGFDRERIQATLQKVGLLKA